MTTDIEWAAQGVVGHGEASVKLIAAVKECQRLSTHRANQKVAAVERLMKEKGWSQTKAEGLAGADPEYARYKIQVAEAELARLTCALNLQNAELAARFHIATLSRAADGADDVAELIRAVTNLGATR